MQHHRHLAHLIACVVAPWAIVAGVTNPAVAQPIFVCDTYTEGSASIPSPVDDFLARSPESAVSKCRTFEGQTFYVEGTAPQPVATGVCRYVLREVFPVSGGWTEDPPSGVSRYFETHEKKALRRGACPPRGGEYIQLANVPDDVFLRLMTYWQNISTSAEKFDPEFPREWGRQEDFLRLRNYILTHDPLLELTSISKTPDGQYRMWFYHLPENFFLTLAERGNSFRPARHESGVN